MAKRKENALRLLRLSMEDYSHTTHRVSMSVIFDPNYGEYFTATLQPQNRNDLQSTDRIVAVTHHLELGGTL